MSELFQHLERSNRMMQAATPAIVLASSCPSAHVADSLSGEWGRNGPQKQSQLSVVPKLVSEKFIHVEKCNYQESWSNVYNTKLMWNWIFLNSWFVLPRINKTASLSNRVFFFLFRHVQLNPPPAALSSWSRNSFCSETATPNGDPVTQTKCSKVIWGRKFIWGKWSLPSSSNPPPFQSGKRPRLNGISSPRTWSSIS